MFVLHVPGINNVLYTHTHTHTVPLRFCAPSLCQNANCIYPSVCLKNMPISIQEQYFVRNYMTKIGVEKL